MWIFSRIAQVAHSVCTAETLAMYDTSTEYQKLTDLTFIYSAGINFLLLVYIIYARRPIAKSVICKNTQDKTKKSSAGGYTYASGFRSSNIPGVKRLSRLARLC